MILRAVAAGIAATFILVTALALYLEATDDDFRRNLIAHEIR